VVLVIIQINSFVKSATKVSFLTGECHEGLRRSGGLDPPIFNLALGGVERSGSQNGSPNFN